MITISRVPVSGSLASTPGGELVSSKRSMALAYVAMAAAFVTSELLLPERR